jgi:hypothetical protein
VPKLHPRVMSTDEIKIVDDPRECSEEDDDNTDDDDDATEIHIFPRAAETRCRWCI